MKNLICIAIVFLFISCQEKLELGKKDRIVQIETEYGNLKIRLYDETPAHRDNFVKLAYEKYFDGTLFHRVIDGFMIQGGDPDSKDAKLGQRLGEGGPGYQIPAEIKAGLFHKRGVIAAAREGDDVNPEKKSAGSQFYLAQGKVYTVGELDTLQIKMNGKLKSSIFNKVQMQKAELLSKYQMEGELDKLTEEIDHIKLEVDSIFNIEKIVLSKEQIEAYTTVGGIPHLDGNYTVFGEVIEGMDLIDSIACVEKDNFDRPLKDISMKIKILK
ncbi:peptidylprolyl isomerase [Labilibaculum sp. K2S]|uniref:peptidylprolyl isomerase n=1 Tax=Labilibaculum sp. K2S TaxID=3056386 RepID=UPI0025A32DD2|nr:peptidylprolyl isomerase [Labilibaculum sp. K2S]MDM8160347.1 peptidylprolyl isomerase [Labilibaculum sp. K2S]